MRVQVTRRGGLAGVALNAELDTAELPPDCAAAAEAALQSIASDKPAAPPSHPDGFQYEIRYANGADTARTVTLDEAEITDDLRPLIDLAMSRATLQ
jgi:hypothetical protein